MLSVLFGLACRGGEAVSKDTADSTSPVDSAGDSTETDSEPGPDSAPGESGQPDSGVPDSATSDSAGTDSGSVDTATADTADTADTGEVEEIPSGDWIAVEAGDAVSCGLHSDGSIECFGRDEDSLVSGGPAGAFVAVQTVGEFACAIDTAARLQCWGDGAPDVDLDALPDAATLAIDRYEVVYVLDTSGALDQAGSCRGGRDCGTAPEGTFQTLQAGMGHGCVLDDVGEATCWGDIGEDPPADALIDLDVSEQGALDCALDSAGEVSCWGTDFTGLWGDYVPPAGPFTSVDVGEMYACALDAAGTASCWRAIDDYDAYPFVDPPAYPFVDVSVGDVHACGLTTLGGIACWGLDIEGSTEPP